MTLKMLPLLLALGFTGCMSDDEEEETYSNNVRLTCNGSVLIDRTFTSRTECDAHKASNTYMCGSTTLTFSC